MKIMHIENKLCKKLISFPADKVIQTSLRYRDDRLRRAIAILKNEGYYKVIGKFRYQRTHLTSKYAETN